MRYNQVSNRYYRSLYRIAILACVGSVALNASLLYREYKLQKKNLELRNKINQLEDEITKNDIVKQIESRQLYFDELIERLNLDSPSK